MKDKAVKAIGGLIIFGYLAYFAFIGLCIWVAVHFVRKWW